MGKVISLLLLLISMSSYAMPNNLILVRHGQGEHNVQRFHNSNMEHPNYRVANLTKVGIEQIKSTAKEIKKLGFDNSNIDLVLVSPLPRTVQTAEVLLEEGIIKREHIKIEPRLIEVQVGDLEGLRYEAGKDFWDHSDGHQHGGETDADVMARVSAMIKDLSKQYSGKNIVLVSHGTPSSEIIKFVTNTEVQTKLNNGEVRLLQA